MMNFTKLLSVTVATILLSACSAGEKPLEVSPDAEPKMGAALAEPCAPQYEFQKELNGQPDAMYLDSRLVDGIEVLTQEYWYAETDMVVYFAYSIGESWCNVWNESGVVWER